MTSRPASVGTAALVVLALFGAACSSSDDDASEVTTASSAADSAETDDAGTSATAETESTDTESADTEPAETDAGTTDGFVFTAPTEDYIITFPGEPTPTPLPIPLPTGQATAEAFIYEDGADAAYFTSVFDYPDGQIDSDPEVALVMARDGAIANVGGTLVDSEFVERGGVPGMEFNFVVGNDTSADGNALVFVDGLRLYTSFALGFSGQTDKFQAFLDSFMFTADQAGDS